MKELITPVLEKVNIFLKGINEEDYDPEDPKYNEEDLPIDEIPTDENPEQDQTDEQDPVDYLEMKFVDAFAESNISAVDVECSDESLSIDLIFENDKVISLQAFIEEGKAKLLMMDSSSDGSEEPINAYELPDTFLDEAGNIICSVENFDNIPVEQIKNDVNQLTQVSNEPIEDEIPVEVYRYSESMVEACKKRVMREKKAIMKYKKKSGKK